MNGNYGDNTGGYHRDTTGGTTGGNHRDTIQKPQVETIETPWMETT